MEAFFVFIEFVILSYDEESILCNIKNYSKI